MKYWSQPTLALLSTMAKSYTSEADSASPTAGPWGYPSNLERLASRQAAFGPALDVTAGSWLSPPVRAIRVKPLPFAALVLIVSGAAYAARESGDRARAEQLLGSLSSADPKLVSEPVGNAKAALKRADDMRAASDLEHAELTEGVAYEWAATAADLTRAAKSEGEVEKLEKQLKDLDTKKLRAQALLEETIARRERAKGKLKDFEAPKAEAPKADAAKPDAKSAKPAAKAGKESK